MRIAIDVTPAVRQHAGVGRYTRELARELLARGRHEYVPFVADRLSDTSPEVAGLDGGGPRLRATGVSARWMTVLWHRLGLGIPAELWTGPVDTFHATDFLAPPLSGARAVVTVHDLSFLRVPDRADPRLARHLSRAVPRSSRRAAHVLADSGRTRSDVTELLGVPDQRVTVAYPGVGTAFRRVGDPATLDDVRGRYGIDRPFVLGVGTLEPRKDWPTLIAAFERADLHDHSLVIAGGHGWMTEGIVAAVAASTSDVRLLGFVDDEHLPALYSLADAFAYPSVYEGFGLPPLEAMACGTPTVVSDASCLPEVVGDAALVVRSSDANALASALHRLVSDAALRQRLASAGPARAARFTWRGCAEAVEAAYEAVART